MELPAGAEGMTSPPQQQQVEGQNLLQHPHQQHWQHQHHQQQSIIAMEEEMPVAAPRDAVGAAGAAVGTKRPCKTNMLEEGEERAAENEVGDGREVWRDVLKSESVPALRKIFARSPTKVVQWLLEEELERGETAAAAAAAAGGEGGGGVGDNEREGRQTVLHLCAMKGETDMMQTILELASGNCGSSSSSSSSSSSGGDERRKTRGGGEEGKEGETGIQRLHGVLSKRNAQGRTPLYLAAQNGHDKCVAMLLSLSSSLPPSPPSFSFPPAASSPTAPPQPQIVAAAAGAAGAEASTTTTIPSLRPSLHALPDHHGTTPLLIATRRGHTAVVRLLLQAYREEGKEEGVDAPDAMGRTAFFEACRFGREEIIPLLLQAGASPLLGPSLPLPAARRQGRGRTLLDQIEKATVEPQRSFLLLKIRVLTELTYTLNNDLYLPPCLPPSLPPSSSSSSVIKALPACVRGRVEGGKEGKSGGGDAMPWVEIRGETEQAYRDEIDRERILAVLSLCADGTSLPWELFVELEGFLPTQFD
ncbi:hypothetical protein VYU27_009452 [Nannochloropsis oceanica]